MQAPPIEHIRINPIVDYPLFTAVLETKVTRLCPGSR